MKTSFSFFRFPVTLALVVFGLASWTQAVPGHRNDVAGAVYTMDNDAVGNHILVFERRANGTLTPVGSYATGGLGTGAGLGNQGGVLLSADQRWLLAVNAGSDEISVFAVEPDGLTLIDRIGSGGSQPISLALDRKLLYVLHAGSPNDITGFTQGSDGHLTPLPGSTVALSAAMTAPAQVSFSPDGSTLAVTEKGTNNIDTFTVDRYGVAAGPITRASVGNTPFGFAFGKWDYLLVSEAVTGAITSYRLGENGALQVVSPSVSTLQTAACWVVVSNDGRFAYTTNAGSGSISGFLVGQDGSLTLLNADGRTGETGIGSAPIDMAFSGNGRYLYTLNSGTGTISAFAVDGRDGSLRSISGASGLPGSANGLAAR